MRNKNLHAVALGRLGGLRGGPARAASLDPVQRSDIARRASRARWGTAPRLFRRRIAKRLATREQLDAGDVENPNER